ncbi:MAG: hypothetical protein J7642_10775 [Cyanobacteria bacterium SBC]|nr:hypothetical protein [Cyanobacteria bacterium SBC]
MKKSKSSNRLSDLDRNLTSHQPSPQPERTPSGSGSLFNLERSIEHNGQSAPQPSYAEAKSFDDNESIEVEGNGYSDRQTTARAFDVDESIALEYQSSQSESNYAAASSWDSEADEIVTESMPFEAQAFEVEPEAITGENTFNIEKRNNRASALETEVEVLRQEVQSLRHQPPTSPPTDTTAEQLRHIQNEIRALGEARSQQSPDSEAFTNQLRSLRSELQALRDKREVEALSHDYWEALELEPHFQDFDREIDSPPLSEAKQTVEPPAQPVQAEVIPSEEPDPMVKAQSVDFDFSEQFAEFDRMMDESEPEPVESEAMAVSSVETTVEHSDRNTEIANSASEAMAVGNRFSSAMATGNPGADALEAVANAATFRSGLNIQVGPNKDTATGWLGLNVHPLQELETIHAQVVRKAVRDLEQRGIKKGSDEQQEAEYQALLQYFAFQGTEPSPLGQDESITSPVKAFSLAKSQLQSIQKEIQNLLDTDKTNATYSENLYKRAADAVGLLDMAFSSFEGLPSFNLNQLPILKVVNDELTTAQTNLGALTNSRINPKDKIDQVEQACKRLAKKGIPELGQAMEGLAKISTIFSIEPFFLFRLMVPFQVVFAGGVTKDNTRKASGEVTDLLNNELTWLFPWLQGKMVELDLALKELDPDGDKLFFHLKGGRAQAYLLRQPETGKNDWDTGIIINPDLPATEWHRVFNDVHNLVLEKLRKFKQEFFILIHRESNNTITKMFDLMRGVRAPHQEYDLADDSRGYDWDPSDAKESCKAELIDIGIPRRDSIEAIEHWYHTRPYLSQFNNVPIPGHLYFVDEYLTMIREALSGESPSPRKSPKRIRRLFQVMNIDPNRDDTLDNLVNRILQELPALESPFENLSSAYDLRQSLDTANRATSYAKRLIILQLAQFKKAYEMVIEPDFQRLLDPQFQAQTQKAMRLDLEPSKITAPEILSGIPGLKEIATGIKSDKDKNPNSWNQDYDGLLKRVVVAHQISKDFETHFKARANFFGFGLNSNSIQQTRRKDLEKFIKALYHESAFARLATEGEMEVQIAICGSFAAYLHAEYAKLEPELKAKLEPVTRIDLKIFFWNPDADPNVVMQDWFMEPMLKTGSTFIVEYNKAAEQFTKLEIRLHKGEILGRTYQKPTIGDYEYQPTILRIRAEKDFGPGQLWPQQLAFIRGFPVVSMRDLIREYDRRAAHAAEWGRVQKLKDTSAVLRELLTRFDGTAPTVNERRSRLSGR